MGGTDFFLDFQIGRRYYFSARQAKKMTIEEFVKNHECADSFRPCKDWNGCKVYEIWRKADEGACVGYPQYALEKNGTVRESSLEETMDIMKSGTRS